MWFVEEVASKTWDHPIGLRGLKIKNKKIKNKKKDEKANTSQLLRCLGLTSEKNKTYEKG
jgi:hypothetical protein